MIKKKICIWSSIFTGLIIVMSFGYQQRLIKNKYSEFWISREYINCLNDDMPCECEKQTDGFYIIQFNKYKKNNLELSFKVHKDLEYTSVMVKKLPDKYLISNSDDFMLVIGSFVLKNDSLYYTDSLGITRTFVNVETGNYKNKERVLYTKNLKILNNSFKKRNLPNLNSILNQKNLECYCDKWQGGVNTLHSDSLYWIIDHNKDSLFIYKQIDTNSFLTVPRLTIKKKLKAFKWD